MRILDSTDLVRNPVLLECLVKLFREIIASVLVREPKDAQVSNVRQNQLMHASSRNKIEDKGINLAFAFERHHDAQERDDVRG